MGTRYSFPGGKGREADHSPPSNAEAKNAWSYTSTHQYTFMAWFSFKAELYPPPLSYTSSGLIKHKIVLKRSRLLVYIIQILNTPFLEKWNTSLKWFNMPTKMEDLCRSVNGCVHKILTYSLKTRIWLCKFMCINSSSNRGVNLRPATPLHVAPLRYQ
jgi:hypothetical protein